METKVSPKYFVNDCVQIKNVIIAQNNLLPRTGQLCQNQIKIALDLPNYTTILDIDELETNPVDLTKLCPLGKKHVVEKSVYD